MSKRHEAEALLLEQVLRLPRAAELEVPEDYLDSNGHVNMMYYTLIGNMGWRAVFEAIGLTREHLTATHHSTFALRQVISYLNELKEGDKVAVHTGLLDFDNKRLHFMYYIVNLSSNLLACTDERLILYVNMQTRKAGTFTPEEMEHMAKVRASHTATGWKPELSGAISLKK